MLTIISSDFILTFRNETLYKIDKKSGNTLWAYHLDDKDFYNNVKIELENDNILIIGKKSIQNISYDGRLNWQWKDDYSNVVNLRKAS